MSYPPLEAPPVSDDTPVNERPPYGDPPRWRRALVIAALVIAVVFVAWRLWRWAARLAGPRFVAEPAEVIMFPVPDQPYAGTRYRVEFYDGDFLQLTDRPLAIVLASPFGPDADAILDALARELAAQVDALDGQRCFRPRVVLYGPTGRIRMWEVAAW